MSKKNKISIIILGCFLLAGCLKSTFVFAEDVNVNATVLQQPVSEEQSPTETPESSVPKQEEETPEKKQEAPEVEKEKESEKSEEPLQEKKTLWQKIIDTINNILKDSIDFVKNNPLAAILIVIFFIILILLIYLTIKIIKNSGRD